MFMCYAEPIQPKPINPSFFKGVNMNQEKIEDVKTFLEGNVDLEEILSLEDGSLFDFDLPFSSHVSVNSTPLRKTYRFIIDATNYMAGVSSDELDVSYMESFGFEDYGVVGGPKEAETFHCPKCNKTWDSRFDSVEQEFYDQLMDTMKCPECGEDLEFTEYYDHVHLEGSKTVRLWKTTVEHLIEKSKTIVDFTTSLLEKFGIY